MCHFSFHSSVWLKEPTATRAKIAKSSVVSLAKKMLKLEHSHRRNFRTISFTEEIWLARRVRDEQLSRAPSAAPRSARGGGGWRLLDRLRRAPGPLTLRARWLRRRAAPTGDRARCLHSLGRGPRASSPLACSLRNDLRVGRKRLGSQSPAEARKEGAGGEVELP